MLTPGWILDSFAAVMLGVAALSAARLVLARSWRRGAGLADIDLAHLLMGAAMAGTLAPGLATLPRTAWAVCFGVLTAWFGWRLARDARANGTRALASGHRAPHLVHSAAMLYMFLALAAPAAGNDQGTAGMAGSPGNAAQALSLPTLALVFALALIGYGVWDIDQLSGRRYRLALAVTGAQEPLAGVSVSPGPAAFDSTAVGTTTADRPAARAVLLSPDTTVGCRIAMGVTMALMLLIMI
jgi:hypothetical protein